ncbi:hypothetical protein SDJN03_06821, partial [Cucurbita argyrosperma subsp. sororia]
MDAYLPYIIIMERAKAIEEENRVVKAWKRGYLLYGPPGTGEIELGGGHGGILIAALSFRIGKMVDLTAVIAEQLMTSDDADVALESVLEFVNVKKRKKMGKECGSEVIEKTGQIPQQEPSGKQRCKRRRKRQGR